MSIPGTIDRAGLSDSARDFQVTGHIEGPTTGKSYVIDLSAYKAYTVVSATVAAVETAAPSTMDIEFFKNGVAIVGLDFTGVVTDDGTDEKDQDATGTLTINIGDKLTVVPDNFGATPDDFFFTVLCRELREVV